MIERFDFQDKAYLVLTKIAASKVADPAQLRKSWGADLVLTNKKVYWVLAEIIEAEFTEIEEKKENEVRNKKSVHKKS